MYTVKWLNDEEFEKLPFKDVANAVGVADSESSIAYVRDRGNPMDIFTAYHELEHLKGDTLGEHENPEEPGVYYKSTGSWMQTAAPFANFIPGVGPIASLALGAGGTAMNAKEASKAAKSQQQSQMNAMSQFNQGQQGMPSMQQAQAPNVIQTGQSGTGFGGGGGMGASGGIRSDMELARTALDRNKGFYSGRGGY